MCTAARAKTDGGYTDGFDETLALLKMYGYISVDDFRERLHKNS